MKRRRRRGEDAFCEKVKKCSSYLRADGCRGRVEQRLHGVLAAHESVDRPPLPVPPPLRPSPQGPQQVSGPRHLATKLLLQRRQPDEVLQRGRAGARGPGVGRAALRVALGAGADARGEAVGDGEREGDGGGRGGARGRRVGVAEGGRGRQRVVGAGVQAGVWRGAAGVRRAGGVAGEVGLGVDARRSVRFHLELQEVKVVEVLHGERAGGQGGHGEGGRGHGVSAGWSFFP